MKKIINSDKLIDIAYIAAMLFFFGISFAACLLRVG